MLGVVKSFDTEVTSYLEKLPLPEAEGELSMMGICTVVVWIILIQSDRK